MYFVQDMPSTKGMFVKAPPSNEQMQKLYRLLHEVSHAFLQKPGRCRIQKLHDFNQFFVLTCCGLVFISKLAKTIF
jgi:hypothetical protein